MSRNINYLARIQKTILFAASVFILLFSLNTPVYADIDDQGPEGTAMSQETICDPATDSSCKGSSLECGASGSGDCGMFDKYINPLISFLAAFVGIAATIGIIIGGVRYSMAGGDPNAVASARAIIRNSVIAIITFLFLYAIINWLQPGGITPTP